MKDPRDVVIAPVVSEKSYEQLEKNVYVFKVQTSASKPEIRNAIESIFDVTVPRSTHSTVRAKSAVTDEITR